MSNQNKISIHFKNSKMQLISQEASKRLTGVLNTSALSADIIGRAFSR